MCLADVTRVREPADPDGERGIVEVRTLLAEDAPALFEGGQVQYGAVYAIAPELRKAERSAT